MNIFEIIIELLSDVILFVAMKTSLQIATGQSKRSSEKRFVITLFVSFVICLVFLMVYQLNNELIKWVLLIINNVKYSALLIIYRKEFNLKFVYIVLIVQSSCALIGYTISTAPSPIKECGLNIDLLSMVIATLLVYSFFYILNQKRADTELENILLSIPNHIYLLIFLSVFLASGLIQAVDFETSNVSRKLFLIKILAIGIVVCLITVIISLFSNVISKKYQSDINKILENEVQAQINCYEQLQINNEEVRRFRHDYINHINCIKMLLKSEKYTETSEYIKNLSDILPPDKLIYKTGNHIADAILTEKQFSILDDDIKIQFDGIITSDINNTDLCIILTNAIDNAIEASRSCFGNNIEVIGKYEHGYFVLIVINSVNQSMNQFDSLPMTSKQDKLNHGFGLSNIKRVVKKYNGCLKINNDSDKFILSLTFNINVA